MVEQRSDRTSGRRWGGTKYGLRRRRVCPFCVDKAAVIDYKDPVKLRRYISNRGKIEPRRKTGVCARHQRALAVAIKRGRHLALLPYLSAHVYNAEGVGMRS